MLWLKGKGMEILTAKDIIEDEMHWQPYFKDQEKSVILSRKYGKEIKPKRCYNNIWNIVLGEIGYIDVMKIKIAFGYVSSSAAANYSVYVRHCFLVNEEPKIIDPTLPKEGNDTYYIIHSFTRREYLDFCLESKVVDFFCHKELSEKEEKFKIWALKHRIACLS